MINVLVVKMSSLGDVVHCLPAVTDAHAALEGEVAFDWVVEEAYEQLPGWHPAVDQVIPVALRRWRKSIGWQSGSELMAYIGRLRKRSYDIVIDAQGLLKSALLGALPARGRVCGLDRASAREPQASFVYGRAVTVDKQLHAVERIRRLFSLALGYELAETEPDYGIAGRFAVAEPRAEIVLVPSASQYRKLWDDDAWIELGRQATQQGLRVRVTWGNDEERQRAKRIADGAGGEVVERLELAALAELLAGAQGVVSLDTGLSHIAAACEVPNVCLCLATEPGRSGALGRNQLSMGKSDDLAPAAVYAQLAKLMDERKGQASA